MKSKDKFNQGTIRRLTEDELTQVVGGRIVNSLSFEAKHLTEKVCRNSIEGNYTGIISPSRKNKELVPTTEAAMLKSNCCS